MAVDAVSMENYIFISATDEKEPKTKFHMEPMLDFEYLTYSGKFGDVVANMNMGDEQKILKFFGSPQGEDFRILLVRFLSEKIAKIEGIKVKGVPTTLEKGTFNVGIINVMTGMEIIADAISRVFVSEEEAKNLK